MTTVDPTQLVVVPTLRPLEEFHAPHGDPVLGDVRTVCGRLTHGWFPMSAGMAYANVASPCPMCFPELDPKGTQ